MEWAHAAEMGDKDLAAATDDQLLSIGNQGCSLMESAPSFGWSVQELGKALKDIGATTGQVEAMLRQSVLNLCPQYSNLVP